MNNAAIIVFRRSNLPKILNFFVEPHLNRTVEAGDLEDRVAIHIMECPVLKDRKGNGRMAKVLINLCMNNNISYFIGKNTENYIESGMELIESSLERGRTEEIKAIKGLAALIKLSVERNVNLLNKNMFFIAESYSHQYIATMCEEAAGVFIYENNKMDGTEKKVIFEKLMAEKGVSAVFTKNLYRGIYQSDVIVADDSVQLEAYLEILKGKVLVGGNTAIGDFKKINRVLLWYDDINNYAGDDMLVRFNDEILAVLRHFYRERSPIDFIRRFPHIYLFGEQDSDKRSIGM